MQFLASSWAAYGRDGNGTAVRDVYDIADAAHGAAAYLCANGGGSADRLRSAIRSYNHSDAYVAEVLAIAARYGASRREPVGAPSGGTPPRALGGFVFPVATTDASFTNDYQSFRGSGGHCPDHPTWHCATDIFAPRGTPILAPIAGRVTRAGYQSLGGNRLWIEGPGDRFYLAHLQQIAGGIREGVHVSAGQVVGLLGDTGSAPRHSAPSPHRVGASHDGRLLDQREPVRPAPQVWLTPDHASPVPPKCLRAVRGGRIRRQPRLLVGGSPKRSEPALERGRPRSSLARTVRPRVGRRATCPTGRVRSTGR